MDSEGRQTRLTWIRSESTALSPDLDLTEQVAQPTVPPTHEPSVPSGAEPPNRSEPRAASDGTDRTAETVPVPIGFRAGPAIDAALDELASGARPRRAADAPLAVSRVPREETLPQPNSLHEATSWPSRLAAILLAAGW
jgi:hypothetical protein